MTNFNPAALTADQQNVVSMVINGECSFAFALGWAQRTQQPAEFISYLRSF